MSAYRLFYGGYPALQTQRSQEKSAGTGLDWTCKREQFNHYQEESIIESQNNANSITHEAATDERSEQNLPPVKRKPSAVKLPVDFFDSAKIRILCGQKGGASVVLTYLMMVMLAAKSNQNGALYVSDGIPYEPEMLASLTQTDVSTFNKALELLVKYGLIDEKDGILGVVGYSRLVVYEPSKRRSSGKKSGK